MINKYRVIPRKNSAGKSFVTGQKKKNKNQQKTSVVFKATQNRNERKCSQFIVLCEMCVGIAGFFPCHAKGKVEILVSGLL